MKSHQKATIASNKSTIASKLLALFLAIALATTTLGGCGFIIHNDNPNDLFSSSNTYNDKPSITSAGLRPLAEVGDDFFAFICESYVYYHQFVAHPESFAFPDSFEVPQPGFEDISFETSAEEYTYYRKLLEELKDYAGCAMSDDEQRLYNYLTIYLQNALELEPYFYLSDPYEPSTGILSDLPLELMTFEFRTRQDIDDYLKLAADVPRIIGQANTIVQERTSQGLYPNLAAIEASIEEAEVYTNKNDKNLLITSFDDALASGVAPFDTLSEAERAQYAKDNARIVKEKIVPAYEGAIELLGEISPKTSYEVTLANQPGGREFYAAQLRMQGFYQSPEQIIDVLDAAIDDLLGLIFISGGLDPDEWESVIAATAPADATELVAFFNAHVGEDFPDIGMRPFEVDGASDDEVVKMVLAFYLMAPVDDLGVNRIKYYPQNISDRYGLGTTLAHESFPGHLYQYNYFGLSNPHPIEMLLGSTAYEEGYAVYTEYYSLKYMGLDEWTAKGANAYDLFLRVLQARLDIGINYEGWDLLTTELYLMPWGIDGIAEAVYGDTAATPLISVPYGLGPLEFRRLLAQAQTALGDKFDIKEFHSVILENGAQPMGLLEKDFILWLKSKAQ